MNFPLLSRFSAVFWKYRFPGFSGNFNPFLHTFPGSPGRWKFLCGWANNRIPAGQKTQVCRMDGLDRASLWVRVKLGHFKHFFPVLQLLTHMLLALYTFYEYISLPNKILNSAKTPSGQCVRLGIKTRSRNGFVFENMTCKINQQTEYPVNIHNNW